MYFTFFILRLSSLSSTCELTEDDKMKIERFVILLYDKSSPSKDINESRRLMFTQKKRSIESIPPTRDALNQHVARAMLQSW